MGSGNVKSKKQNKPEAKLDIRLKIDNDSYESLENEAKLKAVLYYDNEELSKHEDLLVQAVFCDIPSTSSITDKHFQYERKILSKRNAFASK